MSTNVKTSRRQNVKTKATQSPSVATFRVAELLVCSALVLAAAWVDSRDLAVGGFRYSDAAVHAMDGVLVHDWLRAGTHAWRHPMEFACQQYARLPSLGIGRRYPPGFAVCESVFFFAFGVSAATARLCTLSFGLAAVVGCYVFVRRFAARTPAALAAAALLAMPGAVYWTRTAMLEMPTLAVLIWATVAGRRYFERPTARRGAVWLLLTLAAPWFKQTAVFIVPVFGLWALAGVWRRRMSAWHAAVGAAVLSAPLTAQFVWSLQAGGAPTMQAHLVSLGKPMAQWLSWDAVSYYARLLPSEIGWLLLLLASAGLIVACRAHRAEARLLTVWLLLFALMSCLIQMRDARFLFFGYFPVAVFAGLAAAKALDVLKHPGPRAAAAALLIAAAAASGRATRVDYTPDYTPIVAQFADDIRGRPVLFEGHCDGDFIFPVRKQLGSRNALILRASKVLYSCALTSDFEFTSFVGSRAAIRRTLEELGVEAMFVERRNVMHLLEIDLLHAELSDARRYEHVAACELTTPRPGAPTRIVDVYRPRYKVQRRRRLFDIPVPMDRRTIRVDLDAILGSRAILDDADGRFAADLVEPPDS